ncbi:recombination protein RecR [bacterium]|jgi:recombination protein RecR|nr:recombination protein RecR [bacterium]
MNDLSSIKLLLKHLQRVPYLASRDLYRVADYFLNMSQEQSELFCQTILTTKENIKPCEVCFAWKEKLDPCIFCQSPSRDSKIICVVETWQELLAIEKTSGYKGVYHVLKGVICPLDGIGPEDLTVEQLVVRANDAKEIILATNQTPEGEATAAYIAKKLSDSSVKITCLARGVPIGSSLDTMDRLTVFKALSERRLF